MFASTAYEAYYTYIGLYFHEASIGIITSHAVFAGIIVLILGICFLLGSWRYLNRYMPSLFRGSQTVGAGFFIKILACFILGVSLLKVGSTSEVSTFFRKSWHAHPYLETKGTAIKSDYQVSFVFDLLTTTAEEVARFASFIVDELFGRTNSETVAPGAFYRAVMVAGSQTLEDEKLRVMVDVYTESCFDKVIPYLQGEIGDKVDGFFRYGSEVDGLLESIPLTDAKGAKTNCLTLKNEVRAELLSYARSKGAHFYQDFKGVLGQRSLAMIKDANYVAASALVNHYLSKSQDALATQEGAKVGGTLSQVFLGVNRFFSWDGLLSIIGQGDKVGASLTAERAEKFSEYLQRAPHIKGLVKLFLIGIFPWLVFFVVAGRWKVLVAWFAIYTSVLLWTPIWAGLHHLMTSIALSTETMEHFGALNDGISLYSASFVTAKLYQFYAIYSWLQILAGPLPTLLLSYGMFNSLLTDSEIESTPEAASKAKSVAVGAAYGGMGGAANAATQGGYEAVRRGSRRLK